MITAAAAPYLVYFEDDGTTASYRWAKEYSVTTSSGFTTCDFDRKGGELGIIAYI